MTVAEFLDYGDGQHSKDPISHHYQFDVCCFIEDVSKIYKHGGAIAIQELILH